MLVLFFLSLLGSLVVYVAAGPWFAAGFVAAVGLCCLLTAADEQAKRGF